MKLAVLLGVLAAAVVFPAPAAAAGPLGLECVPAEGVQLCSGLVETWDGVPLDTTVALPADAGPGLPLVVDIHGFGNSKHEYLNPDDPAYTGNVYEWAKAGYAVLAYTARGLWGSCGTPDARLAGGAACARGYIHLADVRYEVRDTQELVGRLVDEGVADPRRIGVTGDSYGGGQSLMLAALRDRVMTPDGSLVPWRSPRGTPLRIAAAAPVIPWSDLIGAIAPNGRTSTRRVTPRAATASPVGVFKISVANAIAAAAQFATGPGQPVGEPFVPGRPMGFLAPPGVDPEADVLGWVARADAGEPYDDAQAAAIVERLERFHSAYQVPAGAPPPPLLLATGFTDDLFPASEAVRYFNRMRVRYPGVPARLVAGDFGHQRSSQKAPARAALLAEIRAWFDEHLRGSGRAPRGVVATTQTCPREAPPGGPFRARHYATLARGDAVATWSQPQSVSSTGGDPQVGLAIDPVTGGGNACVTVPVAEQDGVAAYTFSPGEVTLLGAPLVRADLRVTGSRAAAQLAARLWDVALDGAQTLIARGLMRVRDDGVAEWELFPGAWRFAAGHSVRLELLGADAPFGRPSNGTFTVEVGELSLSLPVRERRGEGVVARPRARVRLAVRCGGAGGRLPASGRLAARGLARGRLAARVRVRGARVVRAEFAADRGRFVRDRRAPFAVRLPAARRIRVRVVTADARVLRRSRAVPRCA